MGTDVALSDRRCNPAWLRYSRQMRRGGTYGTPATITTTTTIIITTTTITITPTTAQLLLPSGDVARSGSATRLSPLLRRICTAASRHLNTNLRKPPAFSTSPPHDRPSYAPVERLNCQRLTASRRRAFRILISRPYWSAQRRLCAAASHDEGRPPGGQLPQRERSHILCPLRIAWQRATGHRRRGQQCPGRRTLPIGTA